MKSYSEFETINELCLTQIAQYLNITEVVELAATSTRLRNFANDFYFPKEAKFIVIEHRGDGTFDLKDPASIQQSTTLSIFTPKTLKSSFNCFGRFVKELKIRLKNAENWQSTMMMDMDHLQYLTTLCIHWGRLTNKQTKELQHLIESLKNLKELRLRDCPKIVQNWPSSLCISKVEKLAVSGYTEIPEHFFEYFGNLSSLYVDFSSSCCSRHCYPNVCDCDNHIVSSVRKLPKLENLALKVDGVHSTFWFELPHLKSLYICCGGEFLGHSTMQTLSNNDIIEDLTIRGASVKRNFPPLQFNELRRLTCLAHTEHVLWKFFTKSQMPALKSFYWTNDDFVFDKEIHQDPILKLIKSKTGLNSIYLQQHVCLYMPFAFLQQIIGILKKPCTPKRPFLSLEIFPLKLSEEEVTLNYIYCQD